MLEESVYKQFLERCASFTGNELKDQSAIHKDDIRKHVHQVIWSGLKNEVTDIVPVLKEAAKSNERLISMFADVLAVIDAEVICLEEKKIRENFISLLSFIANVIPESVLKVRLDPETLELAELIPNQKTFNGKLVKTKTRLFYKQQKFNLFREETEGYAKLITELTSNELGRSSKDSVMQNIFSLLGFFNLDPNRVLDVLLEAFECRVDEDLVFVPLITEYLKHCNVSGFCHLIGFKFQYYHQSMDSKTPESLYRLTACLLRNDLIQLEQLYPHLKPSESEIADLSKKHMQSAHEEAKKLTAVILSGTPEDEDKTLDLKDDPMDIDNQKFGLCLALLQSGAWKNALTIMNQLPTSYFLSLPNVSKSICNLIHCTIEPLYRSKLCPKGALGNVYRSQRGFPQPCLQYSQLTDDVFPMLFKLGPYLSYDPVLFVKVVRVAKGFIKEYSQASDILKEGLKQVYAGMLSLIDEVLFPSLSLLDCNCCIAEELYGLVKRLPYEQRYHLYALWKNYSYYTHPLLIVVKAKTIKRAKYITKRLSKENVKQSGRQIGKLSHSNPCVLFDHLLDQIQRYDNFIGPMVDSLKYLNPLAYDVMTFCVIEALANPDKQRMKQSDTNLSPWLQSLSQFCGAVFKKYPTDITGLLQYIANQLKAGKSLDLLVLKEVVQKMSGVEANDEITPQQLEALAGGELLRAEGAYFGQIRNTRKPSARLRDALIEGNLTIPLCLLIAQQRNAIVYVEQEAGHLKLVGKLYDQCQDNLIQFGGFLSLQLGNHDYQSALPTLDEFHNTYGITPDISYFLKRPFYQRQIQEKMSTIKQEMADQKESRRGTELMNSKFCEACDGIFRPVVEASINLQQSKIWNNLSPLLYVTFWSLSMYDLYTPSDRYDEEKAKLKKSINEIDDNKEFTSSSKKKKEIERCKLLIEKLEEEKKAQLEHNKLVLTWMESRKDSWFPSKIAKGETITQFLQLCVFPRCVFSAVDAMYCAKFIQTVHSLAAPNFSTLICFDRTFSDVSYIVASLTENEASRYGRFLCAMLQMVMRWHKDKKLYESECANCPGFLTVLRATNVEKALYLDYENFRHVCHKWQYKLTKALILGIESKDYTQIRNTLLVLIKILPYYPQVLNLGQALERRIEKIIEEEKDSRPDLQALATGYNGMLKAKKSTMIPEGEFHLKEKETPKQQKIIPPSKIKTEPVDETTKSEKKKEDSQKKSSKERERGNSSEKKSSKETSSSSQASVSIKSEREKTLIDEDGDRKKTSRSPKLASSERSSNKNDEKIERKEKLKERAVGKEKEKRPRTSSPPNEEKKRKVDDYPVSPANTSSSKKEKEKSEKKSERKRTSMDADLKETKRRKDESSHAKTKSKKH
ncbi:THO complex subunit 2-like [Clytia hemisphaerica]|uniref:THO complex subunit 2 n=1 Tax=Clytia hemisphaerica TaxID=252671 RepID=A0A7M5XKI0_9CNID